MSAFVVALEGIDGSGKGTQAELLKSALMQRGRAAALLAFPRYEHTVFGRTIARYLNGEFGDLATAGAHFAALLYAGDRFESLELVRHAIAQHEFLILDRYVPSNLAHQTAKLPDGQRAEFIDWLESIEYGIYELPRPDLVVLLDMPPAVAQRLIAQKPRRQYTSRDADLHEADREHLAETARVYRLLAERGAAWHVVKCCGAADELRTVEAVHQEILAHVDAVRGRAAQGR